MATNAAEIGKVGYGNPPVATRFKPGNNANPGGKPVGARNALNAKFLKALIEDFDEGGPAAIAACREKDPSGYVRALVALQPKELELTRHFDDLSDEQIAAAIAAARSLASASDSDSGAGAGEAPGAGQAQALPAVQETGRVP